MHNATDGAGDAQRSAINSAPMPMHARTMRLSQVQGFLAVILFRVRARMEEEEKCDHVAMTWHRQGHVAKNRRLAVVS